MSLVDEFRRIVGSPWLDEQLPLVGDRTKLLAAFAAAGRKLGTELVDVSIAGLVWPARSGRDECGRAALLLAAAPNAELVRDMLRRGEVRERQAVLRTLAALPEPAANVDAAVDMCRTNVVPVFEAIACDNAFPARHFPDAAFFQMVLKALFIGASVARIVGLRERTTAELERMVEAFASERRAAGRPVPDDASLIRRSS